MTIAPLMICRAASVSAMRRTPSSFVRQTTATFRSGVVIADQSVHVLVISVDAQPFATANPHTTDSANGTSRFRVLCMIVTLPPRRERTGRLRFVAL
jgi:hypothetical protein